MYFLRFILIFVLYKMRRVIKVKDFVFETFLRLTSKTVPFGFEDDFISQMKKLFPDGLQKDEWNNYYYKVGDSRTIFASHIDTVSKEFVTVTHVINKNIISTDGKTTLGADDKAGVTVMLWMIQNNVPGLYYFFHGEEVGCIGSGLAAEHGLFKGKYDRIISFDRRGNHSVITHQSSQRCCSESFASSLVSEFNKSGMSYRTDDGGVYTDSAEFMSIIPECTNISVGYNKEHTTSESQDIDHLTELAAACVKVDWENLPTVRDCSKVEYRDYNSNSGWNWKSEKSYGYHDNWYSDSSSFHSKKKRKRTRRSESRKGRTFYDFGGGLEDITDYDDYYDVNNTTNKNEDVYKWLVEKFVGDDMTPEELMVVAEQYLNQDSAYDKYFYDYLMEKAMEKYEL